jgi:hypothetical protein
MDPMGLQGVAEGANALKLTTNGFDLKRYLKTEQEARRVPVAISLVVDQSPVGRVQAAFANSHMRFLTHQVLLNRYPYSLDISGQSLAMNTGDNIYLQDSYNMGTGMGTTTTTPGGGEGSQSANVELVLYGVVSLYNRYPPLPPEGGMTP